MRQRGAIVQPAIPLPLTDRRRHVCFPLPSQAQGLHPLGWPWSRRECRFGSVSTPPGWIWQAIPSEGSRLKPLLFRDFQDREFSPRTWHARCFLGGVPAAVGSVFGEHLLFFTEDPPMLILSRKLGEKMLVGDDVVICVVGVQGKRVKLAVEAPQNVHVLRDELAGTRSTPTALRSSRPRNPSPLSPRRRPCRAAHPRRTARMT
jgi:carbon storage regulator